MGGEGSDYAEFLCLWSDEETAAFRLRLAEGEAIDKEQW
jgi:hypothetical protein